MKLALALVSLAFLPAWAAQDERPDMPPPPPRQGEPWREEWRDFGGGPSRWMQQGPGPGGAATMIAHDGHLFIFASGTLYKIDPKEMKVVGELQVIKPQTKIAKPPPPEREGDRPPKDR
jgi:hypothetical protein